MRFEKNEFGVLLIVLVVVLFGEWIADNVAQRPMLIVIGVAVAIGVAYRYSRKRRSR